MIYSTAIAEYAFFNKPHNESHAIIVIAWLNNIVILIERESFDKNVMSMLLEHHLDSCAVSLADDVHALGWSLDLNTVGIVDSCAL